MDLMSLVGQVAGAALGGSEQGGGNAAMINAVAGMLGQQGGIEGLVQQFANSGLGEQAQSWVGTGQNLPVSPDQIQNVLGGDMLANLASQVGIPPEMASTVVSQVLPMLIDQLTPGGSVPQGDALQSGIGALLGGLLK